jgi:hypothetical protein
MAFRFRKSFKVLPGVRVNLSKSGTSLSAGTRGASFNIGKKGVKKTVGIPGSGVSYTSTSKSSGAPIILSVIAILILGYFAFRLLL